MYTREDEIRAVELFVKYDFSPQSVINELGYPCRGSLYNWYREYLENGNDIPDVNPYERYSDGLKRVAVNHYFEHGRCLLFITYWKLPSSRSLVSLVTEKFFH